MALNASGQISLGGSTTGESINLELGQSATATISLNDSNVRTLAAVPSGQIGLSDLRGKSNITTFLIYHGQQNGYKGVQWDSSSGGKLYATSKHIYNSYNYVNRWSETGTFERNYRQTSSSSGGGNLIHVRTDTGLIRSGTGYITLEHAIDGTPATNQQILYTAALSGYTYFEASGTNTPEGSPGAAYLTGRGRLYQCYGDLYKGATSRTNFAAGTTDWVSVHSHPNSSSYSFDDTGACYDPYTGHTWIVGYDAPAGNINQMTYAFRRVAANYNMSIPAKVFAYIPGSLNTDPIRCAADPSGNLYIAFNVASSNLGTFVYKYNTSGTYQWGRMLSHPGGITSMDIAADSSGNIYTTGYFNQNVTPARAFYAKWNTSGTSQFVQQFTTGNQVYGGRVLMSPGGMLLAGGLGGFGPPSSGYMMHLPRDGSKTGSFPTAQSGTWVLQTAQGITEAAASGVSGAPGSVVSPGNSYDWSSVSIGSSQASRTSTAAPYNTGQDTTII